MDIYGGINESEKLNPEGWEQFGLVRQFEVQDNRLTVDTGSLTLYREDRQLLHDWNYLQYGRFINYPIKITSGNNYVGRYYLDLSTQVFTDSSFTANLVVRMGNDHFFERAKGLLFEEVRAKGFILDSMLVNFPYQIVQQYTTLEKVILVATLIGLSQTFINIIRDAAYLINEIANPTNVAALILKALTFAIWVTATVVLTIQLIKEIKALVCPKIRNLKGCSDYDLIDAGCRYLGFTFASDYMVQFKDNTFFLPVPEAVPSKSYFDFTQDELTNVFQNKGYPTVLDGELGFLWGLIDDWLRLHNLEIFVRDGLVRIETPEYFNNTANLQLPYAFSDQTNSQKEWTYNNELRDVWRRKYLTYQTDYVDTHSPDIDGPVRTEYITEPINIPTGFEDLIAHKGMNEIQSGFALLKRKNKLLPGEKVLFEIAKKADQIINLFGGSSNFASGINERQGIGMIGSQWYSVPKRVYANRSNGKQPSDYLQKLSLDTLYLTNHAQFDVKNQNSKRFEIEIPLTPNQFDIFQANNRFYFLTGELAKCMSCTFKEAKSQRVASMIVQIEDNSAFNTKTTKLA